MKTKLAAIAVLALLMVAVAPIVNAQQFDRAMQKYHEAKNEYQGAYSEWQGARNDFNQAMSRWRGNRNNANYSQMMNAAKEACVNAANVMLKNMEMVRARIEATLGLSDNEKNQLCAEIDGYMNEILAKQVSIQNAGDEQQIRAAAGELNRYWLQIRVRLKQMTGLIIVESAKAMVQRVEAFTARIEARIQELKDSGIDTASLENWLANLRSEIDHANQEIADAENKVGQITDNLTFVELFQLAQIRVREAVRYIGNSLQELKDIISEMRSNGHAVTIVGSGTLIAQGDGSVYITGTGTVQVKAPIDGNMIVSPNATVTVTGEGTQAVLGNGWKQYQGYDNAVVVGTDITVDINGNGIDIIVAGTGVVRLTGIGTYSSYGENCYVDGTWTASGIAVTLETGQAG